MDSRLAGYVCTNPDMNCTYAEVQKLSRQLGALGVAVTVTQALSQAFGNSTAPNLTYKDAVANGMTAEDKLYWNIQVIGNTAWQTASELAVALAPANFNAVWLTMSYLFPGSAAQAMAYSGIARLAGIDAFISQALNAA